MTGTGLSWVCKGQGGCAMMGTALPRWPQRGTTQPEVSPQTRLMHTEIFQCLILLLDKEQGSIESSFNKNNAMQMNLNQKN